MGVDAITVGYTLADDIAHGGEDRVSKRVGGSDGGWRGHWVTHCEMVDGWYWRSYRFCYS